MFRYVLIYRAESEQGRRLIGSTEVLASSDEEACRQVKDRLRDYETIGIVIGFKGGVITGEKDDERGNGSVR